MDRPTAARGRAVDGGDDGKLSFEMVESNDEECPHELVDSSDDEEEVPKTKISKDDEVIDADEDELMDVFLEGLKLAAKARQRLPTKRTIMSAATHAKAEQCVNLFSPIEELHILPASEPEFLEVEMTLDTGATVHAIDILDFSRLREAGEPRQPSRPEVPGRRRQAHRQ